jgi:EAL domain-containing protein (putative c-di-GMP-specific phosphodiesterase class I)
MNERVAEQFMLQSNMRRAIARKEFVLHYQPKVNMRSGRITGLEALIRWNDPSTSLVPPAKFIPILEDTGMILEVGEWALRKAALDFSEWLARDLRPPCISVNVSPMQLRQKDFVATLESAVSSCNHSIHGIGIEITESQIMEDFDDSIAKLKAIRAAGIEISMDDFGTGYSSLSYFSQLPINIVKIDRSFIINMDSDQHSLSIVSMIISLAHALHIKVVAEGVETNGQAELLKKLNCDEAQGYLFSRPLPRADLEALLKRERELE